MKQTLRWIKGVAPGFELRQGKTLGHGLFESIFFAVDIAESYIQQDNTIQFSHNFSLKRGGSDVPQI